MRIAEIVAGCLLLVSCSSTPSAEQPVASSATASAQASASASASASSSASAVATADHGAPAGSGAAAAGSGVPVAPALPTPALVIVEPAKIAGNPPRLGVLSPSKGLVIPTAKAAAFDVRVSAKDWKPAAGDHVCVALDRASCRRVDDIAKPIHLGDLGALDAGQHVLSVLARHASGEFFRPAGKGLVPFASVSFFVGKKVPPVVKDGAPMLFFTPPEKGPAPPEGVLIDFFVANGEVHEGKLIVTASVGGPGIESGIGLAVKENKPLRLQNARPGEYISRVTLLQYVPDLGAGGGSLVSVTYTAKPLEGPFGEITRSLFVTK